MTPTNPSPKPTAENPRIHPHRWLPQGQYGWIGAIGLLACTLGTSPAWGQSLRGTLTLESPTFQNGSHYAVHPLPALEDAKARGVQLRLVSEDWDAYVLVLDGQGQVVAEDDDGGGGTQAQVVLPITGDADYQVVVTTAQPGKTGAYRLEWQGAEPWDLEGFQALQQLRKAKTLGDGGQWAAALEISQEVGEQLRSLQPRAGVALIPELVTALNQTADWQRLLGQLEASRATYQDALSWADRGLEPGDFRRTLLLNGWALVERSLGNYGEAEQLYRQVIGQYEQQAQASGQPSANLGIALDNLANLYRVQGNYGEAIALNQRALDILTATLGPQHPTLATSWNNLAALYKAQGNLEQATTALEQSLGILEQTLGENHPNLGIILDNLASVYADRGLYAEAETQGRRALALLESQQGATHPNTLIALNNLGRLAYQQGKFEDSLDLYDRAIAGITATLGEQHPDRAVYLKNRADVLRVTRQYPQALAALSQTLTLEEKNLTVNLAGLTEPQRRDYLRTLNTTLDPLFTLHLRHLPEDPQAASVALTALLQRKGRVLDATSQSLQSLRDRLSPGDKAQWDALNQTRNRLATLLRQGLGSQTPDQYQAQIAALQAQLQAQEKDLAQASRTLQQEQIPIAVASVAQRLPAQSALVEFVRYRPLDQVPPPPAPASDPPDHYGVYVLRPTGEIFGVDLGPAEAIDQRLQLWRQRLQDPTQGEVPTRRLGQKLYEMLLLPVEAHLTGSEHLLISPDSQLNLIPFAALVDAQDRYLLATRQITYLTSGRDLLRLALPPEGWTRNPQPPVIVADPDYGNSQPMPLAGDDRPGDRPGDRPPAQRSQDWPLSTWLPLPGTAEEAQAIQPLLPQSQVFTRDRATETQVKSLGNPQILHLATHGFFLAANADSQENPLLRSGLIFAGANQLHSDPEDGVLTALEVSGLNLEQTDLVVLSACQTGLGTVENGEGVYGLRRAFTLTGAASQLMSLWSVSDTATRDLMGAYYGALIRSHQGRGESLRQAQLQLLTNPETAHPFYWAAFIATGDWTPLPR